MEFVDECESGKMNVFYSFLYQMKSIDNSFWNRMRTVNKFLLCINKIKRKISASPFYNEIFTS